jgi:glycosyltransferase involved in cell wall biosynthesis
MISVALCTYNGERYIRQQMDSILHQDETPDEIVICDDGSTDHTDEIVAEIVSQSMVTCYFYKNEKNLGYIHNFEKAISLCKGNIIFLSDQDDVWHKNKIQRMMRHFANPHVMMVHHNDVLVDASSHVLLQSYWDGMGFPLKKFRKNDMSPLFLRNYIQGSACAFRKCVFDVASPFPDCAVHDEWLALIAMQLGLIVSIEETLMDYRQWGNNSIGVQVPTIGNKFSTYIYGLQKRMQQHTEKIENRKKVFLNLQDRLKKRKIHFVAPHDMGNFEKKRLDFIHKKSSTLPILDYYSYCGAYEDTKQIVKDLLARFTIKG